MAAAEEVHRGRAWVLAALLALPPGAGASALSPGDMAALMQAMTVMMRLWNQVMGGTGLDWSSAWGGATWPYGLPASPGWTGTRPWSGMQPWGGTPSRSTPGTPPAADRTARLDGLWMADTGAILWIQGGRFILMRSGRLLGIGTLRWMGTTLWMRDPRSGQSQRYTAHLEGPALVITDGRGRSVRYRRMGAVPGP